MAKKIEQPTETIQSLLDNVLEATPSEVLFCGKKRKIGWCIKEQSVSLATLWLQKKM